ncbi:MAG: type IX secretion system plug protein domain-containing protein, partial [Saprospiraceae bacterium]
MKKINLIIIIVTYSMVNLFSQEEYVSEDNLIKNHDYVYIDAIKTVQFGLLGVPFSYPIIGLRNGSALELTFDDLSDEAYDYTYDIVHCNADWKPSELTEMEYLDGFNNENITQYEFSRNTLTSYVNYS